MTQVVTFRCPYCPSAESTWSLNPSAFDMIAQRGPKPLQISARNLRRQAVIQFGTIARRPRRVPCRHAVSLCIDADLCVHRPPGEPLQTITSAAIVWDHPRLVACDPDKAIRYHLWEAYDWDEEGEPSRRRGRNRTGPAWKARPPGPYLIRRVTMAPKPVSQGRHLCVSGTVMVAADPAAFVDGVSHANQAMARLARR